MFQRKAISFDTLTKMITRKSTFSKSIASPRFLSIFNPVP